MHLGGLHANAEHDGDFLAALVLAQQLKNRALPWSQMSDLLRLCFDAMRSRSPRWTISWSSASRERKGVTSR